MISAGAVIFLFAVVLALLSRRRNTDSRPRRKRRKEQPPKTAGETTDANVPSDLYEELTDNRCNPFAVTYASTLDGNYTGNTETTADTVDRVPSMIYDDVMVDGISAEPEYENVPVDWPPPPPPKTLAGLL